MLTLSGQSRRSREVLLCNAALTIVAKVLERNQSINYRCRQLNLTAQRNGTQIAIFIEKII